MPLHIITLVPARFDKLLKLRHDYVETAHARNGFAEMIVDFLSSVKAQHDVVHLFVCKLYDVVVNQHTVGRKRKAEFLPCSFSIERA